MSENSVEITIDRGRLKIRFQAVTEKVRKQYREFFKRHIVDGYICHSDLGGCGKRLVKGVRQEKEIDGESRTCYVCPDCGTELIHYFRTPHRWKDMALGSGGIMSHYGEPCPHKSPCPYESDPRIGFLMSIRNRYANAFEEWKQLGFAKGLTVKESYLRFREMFFQHEGFVPDVWYHRELGQLVIPPDLEVYERIATDRLVKGVDTVLTRVNQLEQMGGRLHRTGLSPGELKPQLERARMMITDGQLVSLECSKCGLRFNGSSGELCPRCEGDSGEHR